MSRRKKHPTDEEARLELASGPKSFGPSFDAFDEDANATDAEPDDGYDNGDDSDDDNQRA